MKAKKAQIILQALVQGLDPTTGEDLPSNSVLQQGDVLRALLAGIHALELVDAREKRRALLPANVGTGWTPEEEERLLAEFRAGDTIAEIAQKHGRTSRAIEGRLARLGEVVPDRPNEVLGK